MTPREQGATVVSVNRDDQHRFSKPVVDEIVLVAEIGVEGDAHAAVTVQHLSRMAAHPTEPNLRQVHLIQKELFDELLLEGFRVGPGELGENITTRGIDVLALPLGTRLHCGNDAVVKVTGLRNPCAQINGFQPGLLKAVIARNDRGQMVLRAGIMGVVVRGGRVRPGDHIAVQLPVEPHVPLERV